MVLYRTITVKATGDMEVRCYETLQQAYQACIPADQSRWHIKMLHAVRDDLHSVDELARAEGKGMAVLVSYDEGPATTECFLQVLHDGLQSPLPTVFVRPTLNLPQT